MIRVLAGIPLVSCDSAFFTRHQAADLSPVPAGMAARPRRIAFGRRGAAMAALAVAALLLSATASATTYTVTLFGANSDTAANGANTGDGLGLGVSGDLRSAILASNAAGGTNIINFSCPSAPCTITLNGPLPPIFSSSSYNLTIDGGEFGTIIIDGNSLYRVFFVDNVAVTLAHLQIQNASATGGTGGSLVGGGGGGAGFGAGLFVNQASAVVTVENSTFTNCSVTGGAGGSGGSGEPGAGGGGMGFGGGSLGGGGGGVTGPGTADTGGAGGSGGGGGGGDGGTGGIGYAARSNGGSGVNGSGGAGGFGGGGGGSQITPGAGGFGGGGGGNGAGNGGQGGFGGGGGGAATVSATGGQSATAVGGVAGGTGGNYTCCWPGEYDDGSPGGGGAAAGPAIFVNLGSVTLENVSGSGFSATAGQPGSTGSSFSQAASAGTASAVAVFNYGGTVNGSNTVGRIASAIPGGAAVPGAPPSTNFGSEAIGSSITQPVFFTVAANTSVGSIGILTQGAPNLDFTDGGSSTCTATTYDAATNCVVNVKFAPKHPGLRLGAVTFVGGSGNVLATALLSGIGTGPQIVYPGNSSPSVIGSGFNGPICVAVDGAGDVFAGDGSYNTLKEIVAVNGQVSASSTVLTTGSGFSGPFGVAVDGAGDVFVADNSSLKEILAVNGQVSSNSSVLTLPNFVDASGVAVDGAGDVFVADGNVVWEIVAVNGQVSSSSTVVQLGSGFSELTGVAVDGAGNVFVADRGNSAVKEIVAVNGQVSSGSTVVTVGSGFSSPSAVAVDAAGDVFVADYDSSSIKEIVAVNGQVSSSSTVVPLGSGFSELTGVAVDGAGNVFVADYQHQEVKEMPLATPPSLTFPTSTPVGELDATDDPLGFTIANDGNQPLVFPVPGSGYNPSVASGFVWDSGSTCTQIQSGGSQVSLAEGASCNIGVDFQPTGSGSSTGAVILTDNNLNAAGAQQNIGLSGMGITLTTVTNVTSTNSSGTYGVAAVISIQVTFSNPVTVTGTPELALNSGGIASYASGSGTSTLTFTYTVGSGQNSAKLDATSTAALSTNGGSIKYNSAAANLTLPAPGSAGSLGANTSIVINTTTVAVMVGTNPAGLSYSFNGAAATSTNQTLTLTIGTPATLSTNATQDLNGYEYAFQSWSAGSTTVSNGVANNTLTPTAGTTSDIATFSAAAALVNFSVTGSGTVTVTPTGGGGAINSGLYQLIGGTYNLVATPAVGYYFTGWTGGYGTDVASASSASTTLTVNGPEYLVAGFATIPGYVVTTATDDSGSPNAANCPGASCSLRDALAAAAAAGAGNITFSSTIFNAPTTITLGSNLSLHIPTKTTITGPTTGSGATLTNLVKVDGNHGSFSMFIVGSGVTGASIANLTIQNGTGGSVAGGGIENDGGTLTVTNSTFSGNSSGNFAAGGAITNFSGTLTVISSTFSENSASPAFGGAIYIGSGSLTVANSTFSGNSGVSGGAIYITDGTLTVTDSTFSGNSAPSGYGGAIDNYSGTLTVTDSILASDGVGGECVGSGCPTNGTNGNIVDPTGTAANLAALGNYGGPTQTMIPLPGSTAVCAGSASSAAAAGVATDQRGVILNLTTGNAGTYTGAGGYCAAGSLDAGAVQTDYAISFTTDPPSMGTVPATAMSPAPKVTLTESGATFTTGSISIGATDANSDLTTSPASASTSSGVATFSTLAFTGATSGDTLTATLPLNSPLSISTKSTTFSVGSASTTVTPSNATVNFSPSSQIVLLSATVTSAGGTVNAGTITFKVLKGSTVIGTATTSTTVSNGSASVNYSLPASTAAGTYTIQATYNGSPAFSANTGDSTLTVTAVPIASISPSTGINFGTAIYLGSAITKTVTITNTGDAAMTISNMLIAIVKGGNSNEFVTVNLCPKSLAAGKSCTMTVTFVAGPYYTPQTANLMINDNAAGSPQTVPLTATVIDPQASLNPTSLSFGTLTPNTSVTKTVTLKNTGATTLENIAISVTGKNASNFTHSTTCGSSLAPGSSGCTISVTFKPAAKTLYSATLQVTDNAQSGTQTVPLSGSGN